MGLKECVGGRHFSTQLPLDSSSLAAFAAAVASACSLCSLFVSSLISFLPPFSPYFSFSFNLHVFLSFAFFDHPPLFCVHTRKGPPEPHFSNTSCLLVVALCLHRFEEKQQLVKWVVVADGVQWGEELASITFCKAETFSWRILVSSYFLASSDIVHESCGRCICCWL